MATLITRRKLPEGELDQAIAEQITGLLQQEVHHVFNLRAVAGDLKDVDSSPIEINESIQRLFNTGKMVLGSRTPVFTDDTKDGAKLHVSFLLVFVRN